MLLYNISHYLREEVLPDKDGGRDVWDTSTSITVSSSNDRILLALWLSVSTSFLSRGAGRFCRGAGRYRILELGSMHPSPRNLHLTGDGLAPGSRGPRPGAIGRDSGLRTGPWPRSGVKVWCSGEALGPALLMWQCQTMLTGLKALTN